MSFAEGVPMESATPVVGRRERSKLDKRRRISEAARAVFTEYGYERANMREIAKRAGVATGTLFLYAPDKRNLLLWILNDDLEDITESAFAELESEHAADGLLDQLMFVFAARYRYWGADPGLSLHALQELIVARDVEPPQISHLTAYRERRVLLKTHVIAVIEEQQRRGNVDRATDCDVFARLVLAIYNAAIRAWLREDAPGLSAGVAELRLLLASAMAGCAPRTNARGAAGRSN
jgi:AcrR family transcriptional regulator